MSSALYQDWSSKTTWGVDCTPLVSTARFTTSAMRLTIPAASLEPCASSAAARPRAHAKMPSTRKKGSFHRRPSPDLDLEKSRGTRLPSGQCSSDRKGWRMRSTSSRIRTPADWNSLTISAATAPSFRISAISDGRRPPASATRSDLLLVSLDASKRSVRRPMCPSTSPPSIFATMLWSRRCAHSKNFKTRDFSAVGVVTTTALALFALRSAYSGAGVSGVNLSKRNVSTDLRTTPANAERRQDLENSRRDCGTTCVTSASSLASMKPRSGHTTVVLPSPMSIWAHSLRRFSSSAAAVKSRTSCTCLSRRMMPCAYSKTSIRGSYVREKPDTSDGSTSK